MSDRITGLVAAPFTPMTPDGQLDLGPIDAQAELLARNGVGGAFICGSTGESLSLTVAERQASAERWVAAAPAGLKVIVHVGANSLPECRALASHAAKLRVPAIGAFAPSFFKPDTVDALVDFLAALASAAPETPFYYYHIPVRTGVTLRVSDVLLAAADRIPNLAGVKYTYEDMMDFIRCVHLAGGRFNMLFGRDEMLLSGLVCGAQGAVGTTYSFAAPLYQRIIDAVQRCDLDTARLEQLRAADMIAVVARYGGQVACKAIMKMIGVDCGPPRLPLRPLSDAQCEQMRMELDDLGFFEYCNR